MLYYEGPFFGRFAARPQTASSALRFVGQYRAGSTIAQPPVDPKSEKKTERLGGKTFFCTFAFGNRTAERTHVAIHLIIHLLWTTITRKTPTKDRGSQPNIDEGQGGLPRWRIGQTVTDYGIPPSPTPSPHEHPYAHLLEFQWHATHPGRMATKLLGAGDLSNTR